MVHAALAHTRPIRFAICVIVQSFRKAFRGVGVLQIQEPGFSATWIESGSHNAWRFWQRVAGRLF
jgi:hypothetical protein